MNIATGGESHGTKELEWDPTRTSSATAPATATSSIARTQSGIASNCNKFYNVVQGDSCARIESTYGITFAQLYQWNPAIGNDCQTLWVGTAVCVGVSS